MAKNKKETSDSRDISDSRPKTLDASSVISEALSTDVEHRLNHVVARKIAEGYSLEQALELSIDEINAQTSKNLAVLEHMQTKARAKTAKMKKMVAEL